MKRFFAVLLSLAMMLCLVACGGTSTERTEESPTTEAPSDSKEPAASESDVIEIGAYMPMTGANAASGLCELDGIRQALDEVNAAGGVNGKKLDLIVYDDAGTTEGATKAATRLIEEDGVQVILGSYQSPSILAVSELNEKAKVLQVGVGTGTSWTNIGLNYTFRGTANGFLPIGTMMDEIIDMGFTSIALMCSENETGQSGRIAILDRAAADNIEIKADLTFQPGDTDFTGIVNKAMASGADTIALYGGDVECAMIIKQLRQNGYEDVLFTVEGGASAVIFNVAGESANGLIFAAPYVVPATPDGAATPMMQEVLKVHYENKGEMPFSDVFYRGYDQAMLVVEALKNCDDVTSGESITEAFRNISGVELLGGSFDFTGGTGDGLTVTSRYMILDGVVQAYDKAALEAWRS